MRRVTFRLDADRLTYEQAGQVRRVTGADLERFSAWTKVYRTAVRLHDADALLPLGREIHDWLNKEHSWITALGRAQGTPVIAEFATGTQPDEDARLFLDVPWELVARDDDYLLADPSLIWTPLRRIGKVQPPEWPDHDYRLGVMFMAAAPHGEDRLNFEAEESEILRATAKTDLDLIVEDTGTLAELRAAWNRWKTLDVLHLSCHGDGGPDPVLVLEDEAGDSEPVALRDLAGSFMLRRPRLLFLSACHTGEGDRDVGSLALGLVNAGFGAVLGWADAVFDEEASAFAAAFYGEAAQSGIDVETAWASARFRLVGGRPPGRRPTQWHLARLFLGERGGGGLSKGGEPRTETDVDAGRRAMVKVRGGSGQIEVANRFEFVGRRPQIQTILREFRHPQYAGVLVYGFGRQGKSSLAARIMDRRPDLTPVVLYQRCDGPSLLAEVAERVPEAGQLCDRFSAQVDPSRSDSYDPQALYRALRALLTGPLRRLGSDSKPMLLVLDDFEVLLDPPAGGGLWQVNSAVEETLATVIRAFDHGAGESRLLLTCRYDFSLRNRGRNLSERLLKLSLPAMPTGDARRHAEQKRRTTDVRHPTPETEYAALANRAIAAARGNTGLRDLLFRVALADPSAGGAAIAAVEGHFSEGLEPDDERLREALEAVAIEQLVRPLSQQENRLLRVALLFALPLPLSVWRRLADCAGLGSPDRLLAFGLWERVPDIVDPNTDAATINGVVASKVGANHADDPGKLIAPVMKQLYSAWGGDNRVGIPISTDIELARLALLSSDLDVLAAIAPSAIRSFGRFFDIRRQTQLAAAALDALVAAGRTPSALLLTAALEAFWYCGDPVGAQRIPSLVPVVGLDEPGLPVLERLIRAQFRLRLGGYLTQLGKIESALSELKAALSIFEDVGEKSSCAVAIGCIAGILARRGFVEEAMRLRREAIQIYEALDDEKSKAIELGEIARIKFQLGDIDGALELHRKEIQVYEALGDHRARAVTLCELAGIKAFVGQVDEALKIYRDQIRTFDRIGDRRSWASATGYVARIMAGRSEIDKALGLYHQLVDLFQDLGDIRSKTVASREISRIRSRTGNIDESLANSREQLAVFSELGDRREYAISLGDIALLLVSKGEIDGALDLHRERLEIFTSIEDQESQANVRFDIGNIRLRQAIDRRDPMLFEMAIFALRKSYHTLKKIGHLNGACMVGKVLGHALALAQEDVEARAILHEALAAFRKLKRSEDVRELEKLLSSLGWPLK